MTYLTVNGWDGSWTSTCRCTRPAQRRPSSTSTAAAGSPGRRTSRRWRCCHSWRWASRWSTSITGWRRSRRRRPPSRTPLRAALGVPARAAVRPRPRACRRGRDVGGRPPGAAGRDGAGVGRARSPVPGERRSPGRRRGQLLRHRRRARRAGRRARARLRHRLVRAGAAIASGWRARSRRSSTCARTGRRCITVHGDADPVVPFEHARRLTAALDAAGVPNQLLTIHGGKHGDFGGDDMVRSVRAVRQFLTRQKILALTLARLAPHVASRRSPSRRPLPRRTAGEGDSLKWPRLSVRSGC